jgi:cold shock CspA family protein
MAERERAQVKWFDQNEGHGWISRDSGGPDGFMPGSVIQGNGHKALTEGFPVTFVAVRGTAEKVWPEDD